MLDRSWVGAIVIGLVLATIAVFGNLAKFQYGLQSVPSQLTVINNSAETVSEVRMRQGDRETPLGAIDPGQSQSTDFFSREGSLTIVATFGSGRTVMADRVGYLAAGIPVIVIFDVRDDEVTLVSIQSRTGSPYSHR